MLYIFFLCLILVFLYVSLLCFLFFSQHLILWCIWWLEKCIHSNCISYYFIFSPLGEANSWNKLLHFTTKVVILHVFRFSIELFLLSYFYSSSSHLSGNDLCSSHKASPKGCLACPVRSLLTLLPTSLNRIYHIIYSQGYIA